jgi:hypothetical protein
VIVVADQVELMAYDRSLGGMTNHEERIRGELIFSSLFFLFFLALVFFFSFFYL